MLRTSSIRGQNNGRKNSPKKSLKTLSKRRFVTRKQTTKLNDNSPIVTTSTASLSTSVGTDNNVIRLKQDSPYDFTLHEKRWHIQWNTAQPSKYSNPDNYTPNIEPVDPTAISSTSRPSFYSLSMFPNP